MAISYPVSLPSALKTRRVSFKAVSRVGMSVSPFTMAQQVYAHQGDGWVAEVDIPPMSRADAEAVIGFLLSLNGREGTFLMGDPANPTARGIATGTPLVNGASQTGKSLVTDGWTVSQTGILKAGDWIQLGSGSSSYLHKVVQDADSDSGGNATLEIWPRLRASPADNAAITVSSAKGVWRLADNMTEWSIELALIYGVRFSCIEAQSA